MNHPARLLLAAATLAAASSAHTAVITIANGNFEGGFNTATGADYDPNSWLTTEYVNGAYATTAANGGFGNVLHFKEGRGNDLTLFLTQDLSNNGFNAGLTASTYGSYTITLDLGWRTNTAGTDAILRFALVNLSESNAVLGFTDYNFVKGATVNNVYSLRNNDMALNIAYDNTAGNLSGDAIGLRVYRIDANDAADDASVVWMDNLSVTAVPEPHTYGLIGAGMLAAVAFVRRRRKHAGKVV